MDQAEVPAKARLVLFAKVPAPGAVKTRLCPPLAPEQAAALYAAFLADVVDASRAIPSVTTSLALHPFARRAELAVGLEDERIVPQEGPDLGARLVQAFRAAFAASTAPVIVRNTDSPLLPAARVAAAAQALQAGTADVVLGPDTGGGYYLVGLAREAPFLFAELASQDPADVFAHALAAARRAGLATLVLAEEPDVDEPHDLVALVRALEIHGSAAPATREAVRELQENGTLEAP